MYGNALILWIIFGERIFNNALCNVYEKSEENDKNIWMMSFIWLLLILFNFYFIQKLTSTNSVSAGKFYFLFFFNTKRTNANSVTLINFWTKKKNNKQSNNNYIKSIIQIFLSFSSLFSICHVYITCLPVYLPLL